MQSTLRAPVRVPHPAGTQADHRPQPVACMAPREETPTRELPVVTDEQVRRSRKQEDDPLRGHPRFEFKGVIAEGGMGVIYRAVDLHLKRDVAVKTLRHFTVGQDEIFARFQREFQVLSKLSEHPNIVTLYDYIEEPPAIIMEFLRGHTLEHAVDQAAGPLPLAKVRRYMFDLLRAVAFAHDQGVVHRDLKTSNLFVAQYGDTEILKVMDFGIAALKDSDRKLTRTGDVVGTIDYMAPEQLLGEDADLRADVFALGIVLFELCTGRVPHQEASTYGAMRAAIEKPMPSPRMFNPALPEGIEQVIMTATARHRDHRYVSCHEMLNALQAAFEGVNVDLHTRPAADLRGADGASNDRLTDRMTIPARAPHELAAAPGPLAASQANGGQLMANLPGRRTLIERARKAWKPLAALAALLVLTLVIVVVVASNRASVRHLAYALEPVNTWVESQNLDPRLLFADGNRWVYEVERRGEGLSEQLPSYRHFVVHAVTGVRQRSAGLEVTTEFMGGPRDGDVQLTAVTSSCVELVADNGQRSRLWCVPEQLPPLRRRAFAGLNLFTFPAEAHHHREFEIDPRIGPVRITEIDATTDERSVHTLVGARVGTESIGTIRPETRACAWNDTLADNSFNGSGPWRVGRAGTTPFEIQRSADLSTLTILTNAGGEASQSLELAGATPRRAWVYAPEPSQRHLLLEIQRADGTHRLHHVYAPDDRIVSRDAVDLPVRNGRRLQLRLLDDVDGCFVEFVVRDATPPERSARQYLHVRLDSGRLERIRGAF